MTSDFLITNESDNLSASRFELRQVRLFEGFICTLDQLHNYWDLVKVKREQIAILLLEFYEMVCTAGREYVLPCYMLHSSQLVLVKNGLGAGNTG